MVTASVHKLGLYCPVCENVVEDEYHVLCQCPLYTDLREEYNELLIAEMDVNVHNLSKEEKLSLILSNTENSAIRASAKFCSQILERRRSFQCQYIDMYICI